MSPQSADLLSWTHYRALIRVHDGEARAWHEKEVLEQTFVRKRLTQRRDGDAKK